jgi:hypothetical protein
LVAFGQPGTAVTTSEYTTVGAPSQLSSTLVGDPVFDGSNKPEFDALQSNTIAAGTVKVGAETSRIVTVTGPQVLLPPLSVAFKTTIRFPIFEQVNVAVLAKLLPSTDS